MDDQIKGNEDFRLDLLETIDDARNAKLWRATRPNGTDTGAS